MGYRYKWKAMAGGGSGSDAGKKLRSKIDFEKSQEPTGATSFPLFRQGIVGGDWTSGGGGRCFRSSHFGVLSVAGLGFYPYSLSGFVSESHSRFHSMGGTGSDIQARRTVDHLPRSNRLQLQQRGLANATHAREEA